VKEPLAGGAGTDGLEPDTSAGEIDAIGFEAALPLDGGCGAAKLPGTPLRGKEPDARSAASASGVMFAGNPSVDSLQRLPSDGGNSQKVTKKKKTLKRKQLNKNNAKRKREKIPEDVLYDSAVPVYVQQRIKVHRVHARNAAEQLLAIGYGRRGITVLRSLHQKATATCQKLLVYKRLP
jgi:hypothetical protein